MSDSITRREFVVGASAVGGVLILVSSQARALAPGTPVEESQVLLFDPDHAGACRQTAEAPSACTRLAVVGDRVRFAKEFFARADAPSCVEGLTGYADYILLSGCAAENGYRVVAETARGALTRWKVERRATS